MAAHLAGAFAPHAVVNRLVPHRLGARLVARYTGRAAEDVFPAHYDRCWASALDRLLRGWREVEVAPLWTNGVYLRRWPTLLAAVVAYEEWARSGGHRNLASHYYITAVR